MAVLLLQRYGVDAELEDVSGERASLGVSDEILEHQVDIAAHSDTVEVEIEA